MLFNLWQIPKTSLQLIFNHWEFFLVVIVLAIIAVVFESFTKPGRPKYHYNLKDLIMSRSEFEFFKILHIVLQGRYDVFPQIHLDAVLNNKIKEQSWFGAFRHVNEKSVDFLLCDKNSGKPVLAIELDDRSHEREDRVIRDEEVERIFHDVNLPLLRIKNNGTFTQEEVSRRVFGLLEARR